MRQTIDTTNHTSKLISIYVLKLWKQIISSENINLFVYKPAIHQTAAI